MLRPAPAFLRWAPGRGRGLRHGALRSDKHSDWEVRYKGLSRVSIHAPSYHVLPHVRQLPRCTLDEVMGSRGAQGVALL